MINRKRMMELRVRHNNTKAAIASIHGKNGTPPEPSATEMCGNIANECFDTLIELQNEAAANPGDFSWKYFTEGQPDEDKAKSEVREELIEEGSAARNAQMGTLLDMVTLAITSDKPEAQVLGRQLLNNVEAVVAEHMQKKRAAGSPKLMTQREGPWVRRLKNIHDAIENPALLADLIKQQPTKTPEVLGDVGLSKGPPAKR